MARKQTRRSISVRRSTYKLVKAYCEMHGISMSKFVELRIDDFLEKAGITVDVLSDSGDDAEESRPVAARPAVAPVPAVVAPPAEPARRVEAPRAAGTVRAQPAGPAIAARPVEKPRVEPVRSLDASRVAPAYSPERVARPVPSPVPAPHATVARTKPAPRRAQPHVAPPVKAEPEIDEHAHLSEEERRQLKARRVADQIFTF